MKRKYIMTVALTPLLVGVDQLTKYIVRTRMDLYETVEVVPRFLSWQYVQNPHGAFGLFRNVPVGVRTPFFIVVSALAVFMLYYYLSQADDDKLVFPVSISLVLAGAFGNLIDRVALQYVVDFILVSGAFMGRAATTRFIDWFGTHNWPNFNVADIFIVTGIIGMAIDLIFFTPEPEKEKESVSTGGATEERASDDLEPTAAVEPPAADGA